MSDNFATVRIPKELAAEADSLIGTHGFSSRAEVVKTALRELFRKYPNREALGKLRNAEPEEA